MKEITKNRARGLAIALSAAMLFSLTAPSPALNAKVKKPKLSKTKISLTVGSKKKVTVKNAKSVSWTIKKGKKSISLSKKSKKGVTIRGKASGSAKIKAKMKYAKKKVLTKTITVTVKGKSSDEPETPDIKSEDATPTPGATSPSTVSSPTPGATATATASPDPTLAPTPSPEPQPKWVTTWGTAEQKCNLSGKSDSAMPKLALNGTTVRQIIRVSTGGEKIRFRLSNQYGEKPVTIKSMHIAKHVSQYQSTIDTATDTEVTVNGQKEFSIPKGEVIQTDEIEFKANPLERIAVSCYFGETPELNITGHRGARVTSYQVNGDQVSQETYEKPEKTTSWFFLADASFLSPGDNKAVVCFGDSITDGYGTDTMGSRPDSYKRWTDYFAQRLQTNPTTTHVSVINEGIGSNSFLGNYPTDSGSDRFARDLLEHDGVGYCIILFGVNDLDKLQDTSKYEKLIPEFQKMVDLCKKNNIKVYGAPILPFGTSGYYSEPSEEVRSMINEWMRDLKQSNMDGIVDFESALKDPADPKCLLEKYTGSDGLHPYMGYDVMAEAIDLKMFEE